MNASGEREAGPADLRNPPEAAKQRMIAGHHAMADVIHNGRTNLRGGVERIGMGEGAKEWIAFRAIARGDGAPCGVSIKGGGAVTCGNQSVPDLAFTSGFVGGTHYWLRGTVDERLRRGRLDGSGRGFGLGKGSIGQRGRGRLSVGTRISKAFGRDGSKGDRRRR